MTIGEKISENRKSANLTQKELGELTGIDGATIGKYERGVLNPKVETIKKIATALNVPWYELYEGDENGDDLKMVFGDLDEEIKNPNYKQRLDSAAAYLVELQQDAEYKSGIEWTGEEGNNWMKRRISDAAKRFNVDEAALSDTVNFNFPEEERWLGELHEIVNEFNYHHAGRISFKCLE